MTDTLGTVQGLAERRGVQFDPTDRRAIRALEDASAFIRRYTHQTITEVDDDTVYLDGKERFSLLLPQRPVIEVCSVTLRDLDNTDTELDADYYRVDSADILWRLDGGWFCSGPANVIVVYDHGYATIPEDLAAVTYELAEANYLNTGGGTVSSAGIGTATVAYDSTTSTEVELPDKVRYVLDCYKDHR